MPLQAASCILGIVLGVKDALSFTYPVVGQVEVSNTLGKRFDNFTHWSSGIWSVLKFAFAVSYFFSC